MNLLNEKVKLVVSVYAISFIALTIITCILDPFSYAFSSHMIGNGRFSDFYNIITVAKNYPNIGNYCITPWHYTFYKNFSSVGVSPNFLFITYYCVLVIISTSLVRKIAVIYKIDTPYLYGLIFSYPFIFGVWRGNTEIVSYLLLFYGAISLQQGNQNKSFVYYLISAFNKPNYLVNGIFYLKKISPKMIFLGLIFAIFCFLLIDYFDNPKKVLAISSTCLAEYVHDYIIGEGGTLFNNSLFGFIKGVVYTKYEYLEGSRLILLVYEYFTKFWVIPFSILGYYALRRLNFEATLLFIYASFILLYPISADYRLAVLAIPLFFMIVADYCKWKHVIWLTVVVMLPKHLFWFKLTHSDVNVTLNSFLNPILLVVMLYCTFLEGQVKEVS